MNVADQVAEFERQLAAIRWLADSHVDLIRIQKAFRQFPQLHQQCKDQARDIGNAAERVRTAILSYSNDDWSEWFGTVESINTLIDEAREISA